MPSLSRRYSHTPLRRQLSDLGARRVISYATLFHKFPSAFLPYFAVDHPFRIADEAHAVLSAADVWADEESRQLYRAVLSWFVTLDSESVPRPLPTSETYFPGVLRLRSDEVFVDCGAFDGDSVLNYADASQGRYRCIIAAEPDPLSFQKLTARVGRFERIVLINAAVGAERGSMSFVATGTPASHGASAGAEGLSIQGKAVDVDVVRLDDLNPRPTYVKMDIEGFEREALAGARDLLSAGCAAFAITLYHRMSDLWQIPLSIHAIAPGLRLFLRHYAEDWAEMICYAIPADRVNGSETTLL
jgi:FkbM family methyltransferase